MARRQISLKVLENGAQTFEVRHRWEDRPVAPSPDGAPTQYLPMQRGKRLLWLGHNAAPAALIEPE